MMSTSVTMFFVLYFPVFQHPLTCKENSKQIQNLAPKFPTNTSFRYNTTMHHICRTCQLQFEITKEDKELLNLFKVPPPQRCPTCRLTRRLLERNTRTLYRRKCDATGEEIISQHHKDQPFPVYQTTFWWSDKWDALDYGQPIDLTTPFSQQFLSLKNRTPHMSVFVIGTTMENSEYANCAGYLKNCYMIFEADYDEDCHYSNRVYHSKDITDCLIVHKSQICYECLDIHNCYNLKYCRDCENCIDSVFLDNCKSCKDCTACINLRHKQYCLFNKQLTKTEYEEAVKRLDTETLEGIQSLREETNKFFQTMPHKNLQQEHNENSLGDYLYNSKNAYHCFSCKDLEDCRYCDRVSMTVKSSMDYTSWGDRSELLYECAACGNNAYNLRFCSNCITNNSDLEYCVECTGCNHCFGCIGLHRKKYCILNKQYSKDEYESLRTKLIAHMTATKEYGEFFTVDTCPYGYNESIATEYWPLTKEETIKKGFRWTDRDKKSQPQTYKVPSRIKDVPDEICKEILLCPSCDKNFLIIPQELRFYRKANIPVPEKCTNCRHLDRIRKQNPKDFFDRQCANCKSSMKTSYPPESKTIVYCEDCYRKEIF